MMNGISHTNIVASHKMLNIIPYTLYGDMKIWNRFGWLTVIAVLTLTMTLFYSTTNKVAFADDKNGASGHHEDDSSDDHNKK